MVFYQVFFNAQSIFHENITHLELLSQDFINAVHASYDDLMKAPSSSFTLIRFFIKAPINEVSDHCVYNNITEAPT